MLEFKWDARKARANAGKHGVTFDDAKAAFGDPYAVEFLDDRHDYGEDRYVLIAQADRRILTVVYTARSEDLVRIISARPATKVETDAYFKERR